MNQIFEPRGFFTVPDGTDVSPFLNATDTNQSEVPWGALGDMSIAAGRINPGVVSWIHCHPVLVQVTYVVSGLLTVHMRGPGDHEPYRLDLHKGQAALTGPGTWFQLQNSGKTQAEVLYIVSPAYVFEMQGDRIVHDDAVLVAKSWGDAAGIKFVGATAEATCEARANRAEAWRRLAKHKGVASPRLADDAVHRLPGPYDYLAPDKSEIRLLLPGEHGGLAHCLLPAGEVSSAVRHRTVEELWYVLDGEGEIWRAREGEERIDEIRPGDSIRIRVDTSFQFRAEDSCDLKLLLATMPPWPGPQEAVAVTGIWK